MWQVRSEPPRENPAVCRQTGSYPETLVLYRMRPTVSVQVGSVMGAPPIQLFEGSRPWEGLWKFNGVGVMREASEKGTGAGKSEGRNGLVVVCVW